MRKTLLSMCKQKLIRGGVKSGLLFLFAMFFSVAMYAEKYDLPIAAIGTSGWGDTSSDGNGAITYITAWTGCGWWLAPDDIPTDLSAFKKLIIKFESLPFPVRIVIEYDGVSNSSKDIITGETIGEVVLNTEGASKVKQVYIQSGNGGVGTIIVKEAYFTDDDNDNGEEGPIGTPVELHLSGSQGKNLLLEEFVDFPDTTPIEVVLTIASTTTTPTAPGWGVGFILSIDWAGNKYEFIAKEVTPEGAENKYSFTAGQFKEWAKDNDGEYIVDQYGQSGLAVNVYNGATVTSITAYTSGDGIAPVYPADLIRNTAGGIIVNAANEKVSIYGFDGRMIKQTVSGKGTITLPQGLYIVKAGTAKAVKVIVK
ncbi:MAG: T9SS type A sorting domain-containing protein [Dysgonamonadaceae bacterium]|jgi:hypothetical protein|nr:T9SS type A sorting domain-containing protein [Dysgonamonadaceae bacterium]